jgi:hypothetical protein
MENDPSKGNPWFKLDTITLIILIVIVVICMVSTWGTVADSAPSSSLLK